VAQDEQTTAKKDIDLTSLESSVREATSTLAQILVELNNLRNSVDKILE